MYGNVIEEQNVHNKQCEKLGRHSVWPKIG